jgi:streptogramin lyase
MTDANGAGDDDGDSGDASVDGAVSSSSGGGSGGGSSGSNGGSGGSGSGSGSGGPSGDGGGRVVNPGVPGPMVTFDDFAVPQPNGDVAAPGAICAGPDGRIWFLHQTTAPSALGAVTVDGQNFGLLKNQVTGVGPVAINPGPDGNVWYTRQQGTGKAVPSSLGSNGDVVTSGGGFTEYHSPQGAETGGIIQGPDGNMWYTTTSPAMIVKMTTSGQSTTYPVSGTDRTPADITAGPDGNLWYTDTSANVIGRITTSGTITEYPIPSGASFPRAICAGPKGDGNVWFVEHDAHNIARITPSGTITEFAIPSGGDPYAIAAGPDGNLWFTEPGAFNAIGRCTPSGGISEYPIPTANTEVAGITAGPDGNMWFSEEFVAKIGRFSNLMGGGTLASGMVAQSPLGGTVTMCTKDTDCVNSGMACGGDVCSHAVSPPACVLANTGDPGWCTSSSDCWCMSQGATCDTTSHHCSTTGADGYGDD